MSNPKPETAEQPPFAEDRCSAWYLLFEHMSEEHGITLLDDELSNIAAKADESRMKSQGRGHMVRWVLVNALYHLDTEQLHELGEAIANRSGGTYSPNDQAHL